MSRTLRLAAVLAAVITTSADIALANEHGDTSSARRDVTRFDVDEEVRAAPRGPRVYGFYSDIYARELTTLERQPNCGRSRFWDGDSCAESRPMPATVE